MDITNTLVQFWGIFLMVFGLSMIVNKRGTAAALQEMFKNQGFLWLVGFVTLTLGVVLVALNNIWTPGMTLLITILGWAVLIKGMFILFFPNVAVMFYRKFVTESLLILYGVIALIAGLIFLCLGLA